MTTNILVTGSNRGIGAAIMSGGKLLADIPLGRVASPDEVAFSRGSVRRRRRRR